MRKRDDVGILETAVPHRSWSFVEVERDMLTARANTSAEPSSSDDDSAADVSGDLAAVRRRRRTQKVLAVRLIQVAAIVLFLAAWQARGSSSGYWKLVISRPSDVLGVLGRWAHTGARWHDLWVTLQTALLGYALGAVAALALAIVLGASKLIAAIATPFITATQALPKLALVPLYIIWFGANMTERVYFVSSASFFIVFWAVFSGLVAIEPMYLLNVRVLGARRWWLIREVYIPSMVGWLMTSLRMNAFSIR
jgi:NitT/TauT family transport system permease protein